MSTALAYAPTFLALIGVAAQIYFNFVPDRKIQKEQLKIVAVWLFDALTLWAQGFFIYRLTQNKGPVTSVFVLQAAGAFSGLTSCAILIILRRILGGMSNNFGRSLNSVGRLISIAKRQARVLDVLAADPNLSAGTAQTVNIIFEEPYEE